MKVKKVTVYPLIFTSFIIAYLLSVYLCIYIIKLSSIESNSNKNEFENQSTSPANTNNNSSDSNNYNLDTAFINTLLAGLFFTLLFFALFLASFIQAIFVDPGQVPKVYPWNPIGDGRSIADALNRRDAGSKDIGYDPSSSNLLLKQQKQKQQDEDDVGWKRRRNDYDNSTPVGSDADSMGRESSRLLEDREIRQNEIGIASNSTNNNNNASGSMSYEDGLLNTRREFIERKHNGKARYCKYCKVFKPDRTHHCSSMQRCVLEMDHYCPWIYNCVGYFNKKYFFLCVVYASVVLFSYVVSLGSLLFSTLNLQSVLDVVGIISWSLALLLWMFLTGFMIFHIWLAGCAYTTLEFVEKRNAKDTKKGVDGVRVRDLYKHSPYDQGILKNFYHLLGPYVILWLIPTRYGMPSRDDPSAGTVYTMNQNHLLHQSSGSQSKTS